MLIKISKNPNASLHSDIEEKGKGKRFKKPIKYGDKSDEENVKKMTSCAINITIITTNSKLNKYQQITGKSIIV